MGASRPGESRPFAYSAPRHVGYLPTYTLPPTGSL